MTKKYNWFTFARIWYASYLIYLRYQPVRNHCLV